MTSGSAGELERSASFPTSGCGDKYDTMVQSPVDINYEHVDSKMKKILVDKSINETTNRAIFAGPLAIALVAVIQLIGVSTLDTPLVVGLYSFSVAIPLCAFGVFNILTESGCPYTVYPLYRNILEFVGVAGSFTGTTAIFWHFNWYMGMSFMLASGLSVAAYLHLYGKLKQANKDAS